MFNILVLCMIHTQSCYGIDWEGPAVTDDDSDVVTVPITYSPLSSNDLHTLTQIVNPLEESEDNGLSLYTTVRSFIHACISPLS